MTDDQQTNVTPAIPSHFITFPPFPTPPPGVQVTSWKDFKPAGIQIKLNSDDEEPELDGTGIPTVALQVKHDLTDAERKKKQKKLLKRTVGPGGEVLRLPWYEEWEQGEALRVCYVDSAMSHLDRLYQAAQDFRTSRPWPIGKVPALWDQWRHFIGLITIIQSTPRKSSNSAEEDEEDNDEEDEKPADSQEREIGVIDAAQARTRNERDEDERKEHDAGYQSRRERLEEQKDDRLEDFLNDPALRTKIFFSAHYRDKGLIWNESHCRDGPILIHFFFRYLLRSRVFPEPELSRGMEQALKVCEIAKQELPFTHIIAKALDDNVSKGFQELMCTSRFCDALFYEQPDEQGADGEPETKRIKLEDEEKQKKQREIEILKDAIGDPSIQIINPDDMNLDSEAAKDAISDNVDINGAPVDPTGGWGNDVGDTNGTNNGGWGTTASKSVTDTWGGLGSGDGGIDKDWYTAPVNAIFEILGPSTLPLTHTTGIVENSTRRIVKVIPPMHVPKTKTSLSADAVEDELIRHFAQLVLAPWVKTGNHVASDITPPVILPDSRGLYIPLPLDGKFNDIAAPESTSTPTHPHAHNPIRDEIHVLIHPANVDKIQVGMGLGATYVQLARKDPNGGEVDEMPPPLYMLKDRKSRKRGGPGKNGAPTNYWYIEQLRFAIPSFHTDKHFPGQD